LIWHLLLHRNTFNAVYRSSPTLLGPHALSTHSLRQQPQLLSSDNLNKSRQLQYTHILSSWYNAAALRHVQYQLVQYLL
jgi:hypothetical protein